MKKIIFNIPVLLVLSVVIAFSACKKDSDGSPDYKAGTPATAVGIKPDSGSGGAVLTLTGTGLGQMRSIVFDNKNVHIYTWFHWVRCCKYHFVWS